MTNDSMPALTHPHAEADLAYAPFPRSEKLYLVFLSLFVTVLVLTNVIGTKIFVWFGQSLTSGLITYPLTFLLTDVVSEIWGKRRADFMVWTGFAASLLMLGITQASIALPPSAVWQAEAFGIVEADEMQKAWRACFGIGPWVVSGSMCAYLLAQLCDNRLFHFWRRLTGGRHLWLRNNGSTILSQLVDTFVVNSFVFYGWFRWDFLFGLEVMGTIYLFKLALALADTPFCYLGIWAVRRALGGRTVATA